VFFVEPPLNNAKEPQVHEKHGFGGHLRHFPDKKALVWLFGRKIVRK